VGFCYLCLKASNIMILSCIDCSLVFASVYALVSLDAVPPTILVKRELGECDGCHLSHVDRISRRMSTASFITASSMSSGLAPRSGHINMIEDCRSAVR
jgi:hypothetical protein